MQSPRDPESYIGKLVEIPYERDNGVFRRLLVRIVDVEYAPATTADRDVLWFWAKNA